MNQRSPHQFPASHRKAILLFHRLKELTENNLPVTTSIYSQVVYLSITNDVVNVYERSDLTGSLLCSLDVGWLELTAWSLGRSPNTASQKKLDDMVHLLWKVPQPRKIEDSQRIDSKALAAKWENPISSERIGRMEFASAIGFSCAKARYILDVFYQVKPSFHAFVMSSKAAKKFCADYSGIYHLYRIEKNAFTDQLGYKNGVLVKCVIVVRYPVPYRLYGAEEDEGSAKSKSSAIGTQRVHCKLLVPCLYNDNIFYKYDGYCMPGNEPYDGIWQWLFQQRFRTERDGRPDVLHMNTQGFGRKNSKKSSDEPEKLDVSGDLLTQGQGNSQKKIGYQSLSSTIVLFRKAGYQCREAVDPELGQNQPSFWALHKQMGADWVLCDEQYYMRGHTQVIDLSLEVSNKEHQEAIVKLAVKASN